MFGADALDLNKSVVMENNKDVLINFVVSVSSILERSRTTLRSAAVCIEKRRDQTRSKGIRRI